MTGCLRKREVAYWDKCLRKQVKSCSNYRERKLGRERVVEAKLIRGVMISEQQYVITDGTFAFRVLMEKYREGLKGLLCVFVGQRKQMIGS